MASSSLLHPMPDLISHFICTHRKRIIFILRAPKHTIQHLSILHCSFIDNFSGLQRLWTPQKIIVIRNVELQCVS